MSLVLAAAAAALLAQEAQAPAPSAPRPPAAAPASARPAAGATVSEVVVTTTQAPVQTAIDRRIYTLGRDIQGTSGSVGDALRNVPGVDVDLQGTLTVRGDPNVIIQIDGRPAPAFQGAARADALQQLPADQIERVEVITNPSAANSPDGSGGIINIVMKQSRGGGRTGSAFTTVGSQGAKRLGGTLGYNSKKLSVTANVGANYQRSNSQVDSVRSLPDQATGVFADHEIHNVGRNINRAQNGSVTVGYELTPKDRLSANASYNQLLLYGYPTNSFLDYDPAGALVSFQDRQNKRRFASIDQGLSAGWRRSFGGDGHQLTVDLVSNNSRYTDLNLWTTLRASPPMTPFERTDNLQIVRHSEFRAAYVRPQTAGGKLTLGYEVKRDDNEGASLVARGPTVPGLRQDLNATFRLDYEQTVSAAYGLYERPVGDLTVLAGLRLEDADIGTLETIRQVKTQQEYFRAFPSLSAAWKLDDQNKLTFSYSQRIQRPPAQFLGAIRQYVDPKTYTVGNPRLQPQETQSFETAFEKRRNGAYYLATLYYRSNEGEFSPVLINEGNGVVAQTFDNLGSSRSAGLELVANGKLATNVTYNATGNLFWTQIDASNLGLGGGERSAAGLGGRFNVNWQATPKDAVQINLSATGRRLYAQGEVDPIYIANLGWRHKLTDRVTATVSVQDLLKTNRFRREFNTPIYRDWAEQSFVSRAVLLRLDYRFGGGGSAARPAPDPAFEYGGAAAGS